MRPQSLCTVKGGKSGRERLWSSSVEFEAKLIAKSLALFDEDETTSVTLMTDDLLCYLTDRWIL